MCPAGDVTEFASDEKPQFVGLEVCSTYCAEITIGVRIAGADGDHGNERIVAYEHVRRRHLEHARALFDDLEHVAELTGVDAQTAAQQTPARKRNVDHRNDDEQRELLERQLMLEDPA